MATQKYEELLETIKSLQEENVRIKKQKKYGLVWENKPEIFDEQSKNALPVLIEKEVEFKDIVSEKDGDFNILIEGDNYHSLSVLKYTHRNKIDVIYIDPPYNTGEKDFIYNDTFVDKEDSFRHSKWLSFMNKRLSIAKDILRDDGVIFISIDKNEQAQLKLLCDYIFKEDNFVGQFIWRKKEGGGQADSAFVTEHEYIYVYQKSNNFLWIDEEISVKEADFNKEDENGKYTAVKLAKWGNTARKEDRPKMYFPIKSPQNSNIYPIAPDGNDGRWRVGKKRMELLIANNLISWKEKDGKWIPYEKVYFLEGEVKKIKERSILYDLATTASGTNELKNIFGKKDVFQNPKSTDLIKFLISHGSSKDATILDFMAGSGTTGHAVLELNKEDGGNRKFILCTNNENNICEEVTYERIKRVSHGYKNQKKEKVEGLGGNLKYLKTDFIKINNSIDDLKEKIVEASTQILCLKESTFREKDTQKKIKVFENNNQYTAILFDTFYLKEFTEVLNKLTNKKVAVYVFAYDKNFSKEEFHNLSQAVEYTVEPIPEKLLETYQEIFNF